MVNGPSKEEPNDADESPTEPSGMWKPLAVLTGLYDPDESGPEEEREDKEG